MAESFEYGLNASATNYDGENKYIRITDIDGSSHLFLQENWTSPDTDLSNATNYLLETGDLLFARTGASVGKSYQYNISDGKVYFAGFLIRARIRPEFNSSFIFQNTLTSNYQNFIKITSQRSGQPGVNAQEYATFNLVIPSKNEQNQLGSFFDQLDKTIALHQRKIALFKNLKQKYLQLMLPQNNEDSPTFRFRSYSNSWEERKFKDFVSKSGKKNTEGHDFPAYSVSNKLGLVKQSDQFDGSRLDDLDKADYKMVKPEEFAYNPARINVGSLAFNNLEETVLVSSLYVVIKMSKKLDNEYVLQFLKSNRFIKEVKRNTEGSVREYLFFENFKNIKFPYTPNLKEQVSISKSLKKFDDTIDLFQYKLEKLLELKNVFLGKMFL